MEITKKYRKKPICIQAIQFNGSNLDEIKAFCGKETQFIFNDLNNYWNVVSYRPVIEIKIETLEGIMTANIGDYIIKGVKGELYPCKPDIFKKTYEECNAEFGE